MKAILAGLVLLLGAVVAAEWWYFYSREGTWTPKPKPVTEAEGGERILPVAEDFQLPALGSYDSIAERPLFVAGRRPPSEEPEEVVEETPVAVSLSPPGLSLLGVLITPEGSMALVRTQKPPEVKRLRVGDLVDGWQLAEIDPGRIVMSQGEQKEDFLLRVYKYPAEPPPLTPPKGANASAGAPTAQPRAPAAQRKKNPRAFTPTFGGRTKRRN